VPSPHQIATFDPSAAVPLLASPDWNTIVIDSEVSAASTPDQRVE
jgi:hypothetical protein